MERMEEKQYQNQLEVLVLPRGAEDRASNALGLDETKPVICCHVLQAIQLQELMEQELFPDCEIELTAGDTAEALKLLDERTPDGENGYSALICNGADLQRLGEAHRIRAIFLPDEMIPTTGAAAATLADTHGEDWAEDSTPAPAGIESMVSAAAQTAFLEELRRLCSGDDRFLATAYAEGGEDAGNAEADSEGAVGSRGVRSGSSGVSDDGTESDTGEVELWALLYDRRTGQWWTDWLSTAAEDAEVSARQLAAQMKNVGFGGDDSGDRDDPNIPNDSEMI